MIAASIDLGRFLSALAFGFCWVLGLVAVGVALGRGIDRLDRRREARARARLRLMRCPRCHSVFTIPEAEMEAESS